MVRNLLSGLLREACDRMYPRWHRNALNRKSSRKELARFYHWKSRNLLPPLRVKQRL
jgi:hypothetical protein